FKDQIMALVKEKADADETSTVSQPESREQEGSGAKILDLTEMLQRSLGLRNESGSKRASPRKKSSETKKTATTKTAAKKTTGKRAGKKAAGKTAAKSAKKATRRKAA